MAVVRRARARQRRLAVALCLLWLLGQQILPDLHLATHAWLAPHQHEGDAPRRVLTVTFAGGARASSAPPIHRHGALEHRHAAPARTAAPMVASTAPASTAPAIGGPAERSAAPDLEHGARSLAHRTLAIAAPAPAVVAPIPTSWHLWYERLDEADGASWRPAIAAAARGPPGARAS